MHLGSDLGVPDAGRQGRGDEVGGQDGARVLAGGRHAAARAHRAHAPGWCTRVCVTPDGKHAVTKSDDKTARVWWSLKDGTLQRELTGHSRAPGRCIRCA